ncbi:lipocalin family protein [Polaribacter sp. Hel1_85]|uniref:lipocalin family protein n=1 Tax=Polaribacter sp. Hel1_85 TaxID=1250005 RepID=UPI00052D1303|nr:lipocalin family protein [Polaribacter sp. Hel1_85]KGL63957.1 hypothetical protein PHEL85_0999 [Polaribacter sp. Hel1_85]
MKQIIFLFLAIATLSSCETNEDDNPSSSDLIIGKWQLISDKENGTEISTECERKSTITFSENGTSTEVYYYNDGSNNCITESETATWENLGSSTYKVDYGNGDTETAKITFSENNTEFSITNTDVYNGVTYTYVITYKKV